MIRKNFLMIFAIAALIRLGLFFAIYDQPEKFYSNSDAYNYEHIAVNLIKYGNFASEIHPPLTPNLYRTPVYPFFIAGTYIATNNSTHALILLQILFGSLTAAFMFLLANSLDLPNKVGWVAGLLLALDPLIVLTTFQMITETLFVLFLVLACLMGVLYFKTKKLKNLIVFSIFIALTSLTRPISQFLPLALAPLFFIDKKKVETDRVWKHYFLFLILSFSLTYTWAYRNYREAQIWTLSAISSQNLLYYRARDVIAAEKNLGEDEAYQELFKYVQSEVKGKNLSPAQEIHLMDAKAMEIFRQYPVTTLKVHIKGFLKILVNPGFNLICIMFERQDIQFDSQNNLVGCPAGDGNFINQTMGIFSKMSWTEKTASFVEIFFIVGMYLASIFGSWKLLRNKKLFLLFFLLIQISYFSILSAGGESVSRFRIPIIPFLAILAGIGITNFNLSNESIKND